MTIQEGSLEDLQSIIGTDAVNATLYGYVKVNTVPNVGATIAGYSSSALSVTGGTYTYSHPPGTYTFTATHPPANWSLSKQVTLVSGHYCRCDFLVVV